MIFENETEEKAFKFICDTAGDTFSNAGCNDLPDEQRKVFKGLMVEREDYDGSKFMDEIKYDSDIIQWLQSQVKK